MSWMVSLFQPNIWRYICHVSFMGRSGDHLSNWRHTGWYTHIDLEDCQIRHQSEDNYIFHCLIYCKIRGRYRCCLREGFEPLCRVIWEQSLKMLHALPSRYKKWLLRERLKSLNQPGREHWQVSSTHTTTVSPQCVQANILAIVDS